MRELRVVEAGNAGLFALGGTRTFIVGRRRPAVIDPGPADSAHLSALLRELQGAEGGTILLTHGHADHAAGAPALQQASRLSLRTPLPDGEEVATDGGVLRVVQTPGHARDHVALLHVEERVLFAGDLLIGEGSTTWVGEYAGCVDDYLRSLDRIEGLGVRRILPAHGPPLEEPAEAIDRFRRHRRARIVQVARALGGLEPALREAAGSPEAVARLVEDVYGPGLAPGLRTAAAWSVRAILDHLGAAPFPPEGAPTESGDALA